MNAYSTRTTQVHEKERELARAWGAQARPRANLTRTAAHRQRRHLAITQGQRRGAGRLGRAGRAMGHHARRPAGRHRTDRLGYVQLAEPVRFTAAWERGASLRLRQGDATALDEYHQHGRIRGAAPDQAMDQAVHAYVACYLAGGNVVLMAADWARCRELSQRIRDDLIHLGVVDATRTVRVAEGAEASAGDLSLLVGPSMPAGSCRCNDHLLRRSGRAVQGCPVVAVCWPDVPEPSFRVGSWLWPWLQSWLQPSARTLTALAARGGVVPIGSSWTVARERSFLNGAALH